MLQIYKLLTFLLAFTGCTSLIITGEINMLMSLPGIGILPGYFRFLMGMPQAPKLAVSGFSLITLLVFSVDSLIISNDYFLAVAHLTIAFQAIKSFDLRDPWDHLQVYFMSLLQLIVASELTHSIAYGAIFIFFLIAFVTAMVFSHFIREGTTSKPGLKKPVVFISVLTLLITALFFVSMPRIAGGLWGKAHQKSIKTVGFTEKVDFGSFGDIMLDPTVVMRIEMKADSKGPYYWRGISLDYFDGVSWTDTREQRENIYRAYEPDNRFYIRSFHEESAIVQTIFAEPIDTDVIFGLPEIAALDAPGRTLFTDGSGSLYLPAKKGRRFNYTVYSIRDMPAFEGFADKYLQLPDGVGKILLLAQEIALTKDTNMDKAGAVEKYLRENYSYSLSRSEPPAGVSPVEYFLFNSRRGYCEHYATAMVLMLRSLGVPARIVTGYTGGEFNEYGGYITVRQNNAHSWVEALIKDKWHLYDPTPPGTADVHSQFSQFLDMLRMNWNRYVVAFSPKDQKGIIKALSMPFTLPSIPALRFPGTLGILYIVAFMVTLLSILFIVRSIRLRRHNLITGRYVSLKNLIKKRGAYITPSSTPSGVMKEAMRLGVDTKIMEFIKIYEEHRFGGRELGGEGRAIYERLWRDIKKQLNG